MKLFCFLGNIGEKYKNTRHNVGFLFADYLHDSWNGSDWKKEKKFFGEICEVQKNSEKIIFLRPATFMNLSGKSLLAVINFYKLDPKDVCVIYDDKDLAFEKIRFRKKGSAGGHNGIKDIIRVLGSDEFDRIKIGVDNEKRPYFKDTAEFVLANFMGEEIDILNALVFQAVEEKIFEEVL